MHPVAVKLSSFVSLSNEEVSALSEAMANTFVVPSRTSLVSQGDRPQELYFLLDGMMLRHKEQADGTRQILSILMPGDSCDIGVTLLDRRDHSITSAAPCKVARVSDASIEVLSSNYPKIRAALRWATLSDESITREWLVNVGQREAVERTAHLFCELFHRNLAIGKVEGQTIALPLTQSELADVLGISAVHMNRVLQEMRALNLLRLSDGLLTIPSLRKLEETAGFDPDYLHLDARFENARGTVLLREGEAAIDGRIAAALVGSVQQQLRQPKNPAEEDGPLKGQTVLIVEDDFYAATETVATLSSAGAAIMGPYANEADAFDRILHQLPDVAVLDIGLSGEPAFELARVLKEAGVPFLFATAYERSHLPTDLSRTPHVLKPFAGNELIEQVRTIA
ncbi:cAMP-binding domain of CRP or a regulatory subunit of cAMP-dependent protein kinases [Devosia crocina]|uniref:cAMP-binding domain of CRP or a regulatory subunit of cAMP-dependent protein kinases n=1 Tax=Devosia crocina TaxID=429728 RepID=A0A1I7NF68_9HYPH|nr:helix-turn-helix domain-containing protein [Devosia crocina]SFV33289.1 cAMP-binding domain of CRP or a regulatory subunit of cAMP-dependent protein kinases [Devosia crocina]